ncbi:MAG: transcription elongation factor GreA [Ruminococcaceae bacterium]|nr:transcription elongation factor GreA [Oscillospiraceae bacterium]
MSDIKVTLLTQEEHDKIQSELDYLKTQRRKEVAQSIETARGFGDLSENSEYDEAKNEQGMVENRIAELEAMLLNFKIVEESQHASETITIGTKAEILDIEFDEVMSIKVVGVVGADPLNGKISNESPLGKALIGHEAGEEIVVDAPAGPIRYKILSISK